MSPMLLLVISPEIPQEISAGFLLQNLFYINCCMHTVDNPPGIQVGKDTLNTFKNLSSRNFYTDFSEIHLDISPEISSRNSYRYFFQCQL